MTFEQQLRQAFDTLTETLRDDMSRHLQRVLDEVSASAVTERDRLARDEREAGTQEGLARGRQEGRDAALQEHVETTRQEIAAARQEMHEAGKQQGVDLGRQEGLETGRREGLEQGRELGREEGRKAGHEEGFETGRQEGLVAGRAEGRELGRQEGIEIGRQQGIDTGRREGIEIGRLEGAEIGRQSGLEIGRQDGRAAGRLEGREAERNERSPGRDTALAERLADAIRTLDRARSLGEILDTLTSCAARDVNRAGVLLVRDGKVRGWRFIGFDASLAQASSIEFPFRDAGLVADAIVTRTPASGSGGPAFATLPPGHDALAVPLTISGEVVAALYADQGTNGHEPSIPHLALEAMTRHASRCLESMTAFKIARALSASRAATTAELPPDEMNADEDASARRYARLLVSEIKLYHEPSVTAGRRDRDLAARLGGEIARARTFYDQRVPAHVRQHADYFHDELVRTLANGDATLLPLT